MLKELVTMDEAVARLNQIKDAFYSRVDAETNAFFEKLSEEIIAAGFERGAKEHFQIQDVDPVTLKTCVKLWDSVKVSSWNLLPGDEPIISCVAKRSKMSKEICLVDDSGQEFWFDYPLEKISISCQDMRIKAE